MERRVPSPHLRRLRSRADENAASPFGDAAILVAALTGLAYALAYAYEAGYCGYFSIPVFLIAPTLSVVIGSVLGIIFLASLVFGLVAIERAFLRHIFKWPELLLFRLELSVLFSLMALANYGLSWSTLANAAVVFFLVLGDYLPAVFMRKGSVLERLRSAEQDRDIVLESNPVTGFLASIGSKAAGFLVFAFLACITAAGIGTAEARGQERFNILEARPDVAFVKGYGDVLIGIRFDEAKKLATGEIVLFKIGDEFKQVNFREKRVGPLAPARTRAYLSND
jgi:hypothetical protein